MSSSDMKKEGWPVLKKIKFAMAAFLFAAVALFLFHNLPRTAVVQISGTDVKRVDRESGEVVSKNAQDTSARGAGKTYDVRFINSVARNGKTMVFRNEDTGWGWPPYFKFNSADLTAQAQAFASVPDKPWVLVKYYGWRIRIFSMFPNAISLRTVGRDYDHFPLFNVVFVVLLAIGGDAPASHSALPRGEPGAGRRGRAPPPPRRAGRGRGPGAKAAGCRRWRRRPTRRRS